MKMETGQINWTTSYRVRIYKPKGSDKYRPIKNHPSRPLRKEEIDDANLMIDLLYRWNRGSDTQSTQS